MMIDAFDPAVSGRGGEAEDRALSSASKVLSLLDAVACADRGVVGVSEVAAAVGLPKSTTHRLLKTLEEHRFIGRAGAKYRIGGRFCELVEATRWSDYGELRAAADEPLSWLFERAGKTVHLAVLSGPDVLYLEKLTGAGGTRLPSRVGRRFPATCTALGKAILAFSEPAVVAATLRPPLRRSTRYSIASAQQLVPQLAEARAAGVSYEYEEARLGSTCIAAPIVRDGRALAAISMSVPATRAADAGDRKLVRDAAAQVSGLLAAS